MINYLGRCLKFLMGTGRLCALRATDCKASGKVDFENCELMTIQINKREMSKKKMRNLTSMSMRASMLENDAGCGIRA